MAWSLMRKPNSNVSLFKDFQHRINSLFEDFWKQDSDQLMKVHFEPRIDITENEKQYLIKADLPGLSEKEIDVELADNLLSIKGERKQSSESKSESGLIREVSYGYFQRSIALPESILVENTKATYKNGVLNIEIPKDATKAAKQIKVKTE